MESKEIVVPDSVEIVPESEETVAADDVGHESEEVAADSVDLLAMVPDSMESSMLSMDSVDLLSMVPHSMESPDSLPPGAFVCGRCQVVHLNRKAWDRVHTGKYPCSRCGLKHDDYLIFPVVHGIDKFECELFIPDVNKVVFGVGMEKILLPPDVLKKVEEEAKERRERKLAAKKAMEDAKAAR